MNTNSHAITGNNDSSNVPAPVQRLLGAVSHLDRTSTLALGGAAGAIVMTAFPWFSGSVGSFSFSASGIEDWRGLLTIVCSGFLGALILLPRFAAAVQSKLPTAMGEYLLLGVAGSALLWPVLFWIDALGAPSIVGASYGVTFWFLVAFAVTAMPVVVLAARQFNLNLKRS